VKPQEDGRTPQRHQAIANAKQALHREEGREAQLTPERAPTRSVSRRGAGNTKPTPAHTSRVPTLNDLALINPAQAKRRQERIIARTQANAKQVVRPSDLKDSNKKLEF
jgi:hypothetical protein